MGITLTPEQQKIIKDLLATGNFNSVGEVIQAALNLLEQERLAYQVWVDETRAKIDEGIVSLERGEGIDGETFVNQLLADLQHVQSEKCLVPDELECNLRARERDLLPTPPVGL